MRAVIDAIPLLIRSAGVKNYLYYWIESLRRIAGSDVIRTFPEIENLAGLQHDSSITTRSRTIKGLGSLAASNYLHLPVLEWATRGADVFHTTNMVRHPPRRPRLTATIFDMTTRLMPQMHSPANLRADRAFEEIIRRADGLIAISRSTRDDAVRLLGIHAEKIDVIYPGISAGFYNVDPAAVARVRERYRLTKPFVLYVGTIEPRKNLPVLFDAFEALPESVREEFEFVIAGSTGWAEPKTIARLESFRYLGYVPETEIAPLTSAAAVFAYPSLYEGFGFPVAQAMAAGSAVITSNVSSMPEVAGDAGLLVDPRSVSELRDALCRLLLSPDLRTELARRGRVRANAFRWEDSAAASLRFFEKVVQ